MDNKLIFTDDHQIFEYLSSQKNPFAKGWVKIYANHKKNKRITPIFEGPNLISGNGREFSAQRLFNMNTGSTNDYTKYKISGFGVGKGGATIVDAKPVLEDVTLDDTHLFSPISLKNDYATEQSTGTAGVIKPISTDGSIELVNGGYGTQDYFSKVKCTCIVANGEPTYLDAGESEQMSEAALYATNITNVENNILFSHITFPPKWNEVENIFTIEWYIIC